MKTCRTRSSSPVYLPTSVIHCSNNLHHARNSQKTLYFSTKASAKKTQKKTFITAKEKQEWPRTQNENTVNCFWKSPKAFWFFAKKLFWTTKTTQNHQGKVQWIKSRRWRFFKTLLGSLHDNWFLLLREKQELLRYTDEARSKEKLLAHKWNQPNESKLSRVCATLFQTPTVCTVISMKDPFCSSTKESAETSKVFFFCQNVSKKNDIFQKSYHQGKMTKVQNTPFFDHKSQNTTKGNVKTGFQRQQKTATKAPPRENS